MNDATVRCERPQPRGWFCHRGPHPFGTPCASAPRWWLTVLRPRLRRFRR